MLRKLLITLTVILAFQSVVLAQPVTVGGVTVGGRLLSCAAALPTVTVTRTGGPGSSVVGGALVCTDPCDTTVLLINITGIRWNQTPNAEWIHGLFFPVNAGYTVRGVTLPGGWITQPTCIGAACSAQLNGGPGFYFDGTTSASCCTNSNNDGIPNNNWGVLGITCTTPISVQFEMRVCNNLITTTSLALRIRATSDGGTGCWSTPDPATNNTLDFSLNTVTCGPLYVPAQTATPIAKTCTPAPDYTATFTGGCSNSNTITWWDAPTGGNIVGTGSPFVWHSNVCASKTLYASCCPEPMVCNTRRAATATATCTPDFSIAAAATSQPTCANPTGGCITVTPANASTAGTGNVTYTISPGGGTQTGTATSPVVFCGLGGGSYTITAIDAAGCSAASGATLTVAPGAGPAPTVVSPVNYCVGDPATPLTATGTNLTWYPAATGGGGTTTAPVPSTAAAGTTSYWVSQNPSGNCESGRAQIDVIVSASSTIVLTSASTTNNQTVCVNNPITNIVYTTGAGATGASITAGALPTGVTGVYSGGTNGTFTISGTPSVTGTFNYTVTTSGGCGAATASGTIIVSSPTSITLTSAAPTAAQTVCINTGITNIVYTTANGATGASITAGALPAGVTGTYSGGTNGTFTISGTPTVSGTFNYTVTTTGGCASASQNGTITVTPAVTMTLTSAPATTAQSLCVNTGLTNIVYTTGSGATGASITAGALPAGVTGVYSGGTNGTFTISGTPTATGTFNYTVTTSGGCNPAVSLSGTITVNPTAVITLTSAPATTSQTVCINTPITNITYSTGGGITGATVGGLPTGVTGTWASNVVTISGTPTVSGTFNYTISTTGSSCGTPSATGTITVTPAATITLTSAAGTDAQTVCQNTAITNIAYTIGGSATGASITAGALPAGVTGSFSGGVFTIAGTPTASGTFNYTVTTSGGCGTPAPSLSGTITVTALATLTLTSAPATANQTVNINTPITNIVYTIGGSATGASITAGALPAGVTGSFSGTTFTISGTPTVSGTFNYTVTTTGGCTPVSLSGTIIINDLTGITLTSATGTDAQTVCISTPITNIVYTTSGGATGASITAGALPAGLTGAYSGGNNGTFTISGTPTVSGTFNYTISTSGGVGTATISGSVTVSPNATITLSSGTPSTTQTVCINTGINSITYTTANGVTGATFGGLPAGVTGGWSANTVTISGTPTIAGTYNYTVTTTGGCSSASATGTITVSPAATMTLSSAAGSDAQTLCIGTLLPVNITYTTANGVTGATFTGLPTGITGSWAANTVTISGTPTVAGTFNYNIQTTGGCAFATATGTITVNPNVTMTLTTAPATAAQTVCINTAISQITYTTGSGATGASITNGTLPPGVTGTYSGGTNGTFDITGTPTAAGTYNYTLTTSGGCSSVTLTGSITVSPASTITRTSPTGTDAQTLCISTNISNIVYSTANGVTAASVSGLPAGVTGSYGGGTNGSFTISGIPTVTGTFNYIVTTTGGCGNATANGTITVTPNVTMTLSTPAGSNTQTVCINTPINSIGYGTTNGVTNIFISAGSLPPGVTGAYTGGTDGSFNITGTPTATGTYPYTVTTTGGCSAVSLSGTITVSPNVTISLSSVPATTNQAICINTGITSITYTTANGVTGATFGNLPPGVNGSYSGGTDGTVTISGNATAAGTYNYTVTTTGGCGSATATGTIIVNPLTTMTLSSAAGTDAQTICINTALTCITYQTANGATGASITAGALPPGITGVYSGGTDGHFDICGTPTAAGTYTYTVTTTGGCGTVSLTGTITVSPNVTMTLTSPAATDAQTVCINTAIANIEYTTTNGATGVNMINGVLPAGVTASFSGGIYTISGTPTVAGTFPYTIQTTGGCSSVTLTGSITVSPAATITLSSAATTDAQTVCISTPIINITYNTANGVTGATAANLPTGVTGVWAANVFTISGTPTVSGPFAYTITTTGGCGTATATGTITVNPNVTMTLSSPTGSDAQTACINTPISSIIYTVAQGATGASITAGALPAGITGSFAGTDFTISGTPTVSGTFNYTVTTTGGCSSVSMNGTITVDPAATITLTSSPATTAQALCENSAINNIVYTTANGATGATVTGLPAGVTGNWAANVFTISGTPAVGSPGVFNYTVSTTGGCGTATLNGSITVVAIPAAPVVVTPVTYCPGDASVPLTATGTNLLWYTTATGGSGSAIAPTPSTAVSGTTTSYWVSQSTITASCESPRSQIDVIVTNPLVVAIGNDTTICQGDTARFTPVVTPAATVYQWRLYTGTPNSILDANVLNGAMFPVDTSSYILRATLGGCSAEDTVIVNVRWKPIIEAGQNAAICLDRSNGVNSVVLTAGISHISNALGTPINYGWTPTDSLSTPLSLTTLAYPTRTTWYYFTDTLTTTNYGCDFIVHDSVKVVVQPIVHAFAGRDTIGQLNALHRLHGTGGLTYLWTAANPSMVITHANSQNADVMLTGDGNFYLEAKDVIGCIGRDSVFVKAYDGPEYWVPNAFSPNGDGLNDVFRAIPPGIATTTYFRVFNRFGELLFETNQYLKGWDGTYKGKPQPAGVYIWSIKGVDRNRQTVEKQGTVMLVR